MEHRNNILKELRELESSLVGTDPKAVFQVPAGYFDRLAGEILSKIMASDAASPGEELAFLSPALSSISKATPYLAPPGYFEGLEKKLQELIFSGKDQSAKDELENLSPLLLQLKDKPTYSVPEDYFDHVRKPGNVAAPATKAKVVSITSRKWLRYASAAIVVGVVAVIGFKLLNKNETGGSAEKSYAWVKNNLKKVSTDEINEFVELANTASSDVARTETKDEFSSLIKDVSDKEIQDFLNDTQTAESESNDDLIMN